MIISFDRSLKKVLKLVIIVSGTELLFISINITAMLDGNILWIRCVTLIMVKLALNTDCVI